MKMEPENLESTQADHFMEVFLLAHNGASMYRGSILNSLREMREGLLLTGATVNLLGTWKGSMGVGGGEGCWAKWLSLIQPGKSVARFTDNRATIHPGSRNCWCQQLPSVDKVPLTVKGKEIQGKDGFLPGNPMHGL